MKPQGYVRDVAAAVNFNYKTIFLQIEDGFEVYFLMKKSEILNRRKFFKRSVGYILPIIGFTAFSTLSAVAQTNRSSDCKGNCTTSCYNNCRYLCHKDGCTNTCAASCILTCSHSAARSQTPNDSLKIQNDTIK